MLKGFHWYLKRVACLGFVLAAAATLGACAHDDGAPSAGAKDMPGAAGTIVFKPADWEAGATTYWLDTDGIAPDVPGCHIGADSSGVPNGRVFAEACLPDGRLVESNPGRDELHSHSDDTGHPDTFDCQQWCVGTGHSSGACAVAQTVACGPSAICACE